MSNKKNDITPSDLISIIILEYNAMRDEIRSSHNHIFISMQIYIAFVAAVLTLVLPNVKNPLIFHSILCLFIPLICYSALLIIFGESMRVKRAGDYICFLELKTNLLFSDFYTEKEIENWFQTQISLEKWLKLSHSDLNLINSLCFERWIREASEKNSYYGRSNIILQIRYITFFVIAFLSIVTSIGITLYDVFYTKTSILGESQLYLQIFSSLFVLLIYLYLIKKGFEFQSLNKTNQEV